MLIYDHLRGVSVVSSPGAWNLLSFDLGDNTLFTPLGNKKPLLLFHHADGQKAYDKDYMFFSELDGKEVSITGNMVYW